MDLQEGRKPSPLSKFRQKVKSLLAFRSTRRESSLDRHLVLSLSKKKVPSRNQLRHLPHFLSSRERTILGTATLILLVTLGVLGTRFALSHIKDAPADGGQYVEASVGGPRFVNPILALSNDVDLDIARLVFTGLMKVDGQGVLQPDLAETYEISEDGLTYTFVLREGVNWHDGAPLGASDVSATINFIKDPAFKSPLFQQFRNVSVETPDEHTVIFRLEETFAPFLSLLTVGIMPIHLWQEIIPENSARAELNVKPIGTGPFRFKSFTKDKNGAIRSYTLSRNDDFYGQKAHLEEIVLVFYQGFDEAAAALTGRKVDGLSYLPLEYRESVDKISSPRTHAFRLPQYTAIFFNQDHNPILEDEDVRLALAVALDQDKILTDTLGFNGVPVHGPILPGYLGFYPEIDRHEFDQEEAAELLDDAGWELNEHGLRSKKLPGADGEKVDTVLTINLTTVDAAENETAARIVEQMWGEIGVRTEIELVPASRIQQDKLRPRSYDALLYGEILGADPDPYPFWHSSQAENGGLNLSKFNNRQADQLLEQAREEIDPEKRDELYRDFQDILIEEIPAIFLYSPTYSFAVDRRVQGIEPGLIFTPADRFGNVSDWYVKTRKIWE